MKLDVETVKLIKIEHVKVEYEFNVGDEVLGSWSDKNHYPAKIIALLSNGYHVEFYDGFKEWVNRFLYIYRFKYRTVNNDYVVFSKNRMACLTKFQMMFAINFARQVIFRTVHHYHCF